MEEFGACQEDLEDPRTGNAALHDFHDLMMIALCTVLCGGRNETDAKSNKITAAPQLLEMLSLKGAIVTVDAMNCQRDIAQQIVDRGGDYALALKGNQRTAACRRQSVSQRSGVHGRHEGANGRCGSRADRDPHGHGHVRHRLAAKGA